MSKWLTTNVPKVYEVISALWHRNLRYAGRMGKMSQSMVSRSTERNAVSFAPVPLIR